MARIKIDVTRTQLEAIKAAGDNHSAMDGVGNIDSDKEFRWIVKHIDKMLKDNNLEPRKFK